MEKKKQSKNRSLDMVNGPLLKNVIIFAIPLMFSTFLQMLFNAADTVIVGKFAGEEALAAVGANGSLIFLMTSLFNGLAVGTNVIVAKSIGAGDKDRIGKSVHTSICVALISGIFLSIVGIVFAPVFLRLMNTPEDIIDLSVLYMRIYFSGTVFMLVYNFGGAILRSKGDTKRPLYFLATAGVLNVVLNLFMVVVLEMSVAGVAIATVISQALSAFLVCRALVVDDDDTHLDIKKLRIHGASLKELLHIGVPAGLQGAVFAIANVVIQSSINSFDSTAIVAGNAAGANIEGFVYIGCGSFSNACVTFMSQNVGARRFDKVLKIFGTTMILAIVAAGTLSVLVYLNGPVLLSLYTDSPEVVEVGMIRTRGVALLLFLNGVLDVFVSSLRGLGYSLGPTLIMIGGICGVRLLWIWLYFPAHRSLGVLYFCFPLSWIVSSVIECVFLLTVYNKVIKKKISGFPV